MSTATKTYIKKSIERLYGIIEGIAINYHINDQEVLALKNWLEIHHVMHEFYPFKELKMLLEEILEDSIIDENEREELLEWCSDAINERGFLNDFKQIIRRLHGLFSGIACDNVITPDELEGLQDWLLDYESLHDWWPINELIPMLNDILADGKVDEEEHQRLHTFFADFAEQVIEDPAIYDEEYWLDDHMVSPSPIFKPISSICEKNPDICFQGKRFCLTGPAASGKRKDILQEIENLGGIPHDRVVVDLDYLVIGAQSSPAWLYSTYGKKIETVINRKEKNPDCTTLIISEHDFVQAAKSEGALI